ncbi:Atrochrysone carboxyl ACP thioesterase (ACTE) (Endocrocin synthesis protein B), partial [Durusdinium trenchii]
MVWDIARPPALAPVESVTVEVLDAHRVEVGYRLELLVSNQGSESTRQLTFAVQLLGCSEAVDGECQPRGSDRVDMPMHVPPGGEYPLSRILTYDPLPEEEQPAWRVTVEQAVSVGHGIWRLLALNPGMMSGPGTNTYMISAEDGLWVLDPGPEDSRHVDNLEAACAEIGQRVTTVLCTHTHRDHSPCTALIKERFDVRTLGPAPLDDALQDHSWDPDEVLCDGQVLSLGDSSLK